MDNKENTNSAYGPFASMYHNLFDGRKADLNFFTQQAKKFGSPVLELGSGTGRLLIHLAGEVDEVHGVELQEGMLRMAGEKISCLDGTIRRRISLHQGDMRSFSIPCKFNLVFTAFNTWAELRTRTDREQALSCIYDHMNSGGCLVIDNSCHRVARTVAGLVVHRLTYKENGKTVSCFSTDDFYKNDSGENFSRTVFLDTVYPPDNTLKREIYEFYFSIPTVEEIEAELRNTGFNKIEVYGNFDLEPYSNDSDRQIFFAFKD